VDYVVLDTDVASQTILQQLTGVPPVNDSWIAASCLAHGLPLATLNSRDFLDLADHEGLTLLTN
jgi:predicted nucleic acid-binding protein